MRTIFTVNDTKRLFENIFNSNSEKISLYDGYENTEKDLVEYLNISFYTFKNRLVHENENGLIPVESWLESLNYSLNKGYGLVEQTNASAVASQDIDSATINGRVSFIIQTNKVTLLEYYITKLRNVYLGAVQDFQNSYGEIRKAYIGIGILLYDEEPFNTVLGECVQVSLNFNINYLNNALTYNDYDFEFSFNGTNYSKVYFTESSFKNIFTGTAITRQNVPTITGMVMSNVSQALAVSFYDFDSGFTQELNKKFWELGAYNISPLPFESEEDYKEYLKNLNPNITIFLRVTYLGVQYYYKYVIKEIIKSIPNSQFSTTTLSLIGYGKE